MPVAYIRTQLMFLRYRTSALASVRNYHAVWRLTSRYERLHKLIGNYLLIVISVIGSDHQLHSCSLACTEHASVQVKLTVRCGKLSCEVDCAVW